MGNIIDIPQLEFCMFECATIELVKNLNIFNKKLAETEGYGPIENIKYRIKSPNSIIKKLESKNLPITYESIVENINDVAGIRIVCSFLDNIYTVFNYLQEQEDLEIINVKDYVENPKPNGYRSVHVILRAPVGFKDLEERVTIEIQIRTVAMDFWATLEHKLIYKSVFSENVSVIRNELNHCGKVINELDERMIKLKKEVMNGDEENEEAFSSRR